MKLILTVFSSSFSVLLSTLWLHRILNWNLEVWGHFHWDILKCSRCETGIFLQFSNRFLLTTVNIYLTPSQLVLQKLSTMSLTEWFRFPYPHFLPVTLYIRLQVMPIMENNSHLEYFVDIPLQACKISMPNHQL